ncbi:hypothetical protein HRG_009185 [Hirsutella rhossiliensis]|uniref:SnoaL-like domain-containing protein n=1 Tax=Hirsutella rhossiliensis TaxID=111463 RepID=A0A9P8SE29_9HYPO|nr:uncharacterized protein HRG_09185 [Hirsutella rhossiliensis]KAH0959403.1 hypothetical protein HRG_09185 [Hirsutella rhossiliensis]
MSRFILTKDFVGKAFLLLTEVHDQVVRNCFFADFVTPDVIWTMAGSAHSLAGTRHSLQSHMDATFNHLRRRLQELIKFVVTKIIVDTERSEDGWWACIEAKGQATRKTGHAYNNDYIWLTRWNDEGRIAEVRYYFDTMLSEQVLQEAGNTMGLAQ